MSDPDDTMGTSENRAGSPRQKGKTMAEVRITKAMRFAEIKAILEGEIAMGEDVADLVDFVDHEVALLSKKRNTAGTLTPDQMENEKVKAAIATLLSDGTPRKSSEIAKEMDIAVQKSTALLRQMVLAGVAVRNEAGKDVTFSVE
jgi:hypothetical protein